MTFLVQLWTKSLPLGALVGLGVIFGTGAINYQKMDKVINEGIGLMGYVVRNACAAGFAAVLKATGGIDTFVNAILPFMTNKIVARRINAFNRIIYNNRNRYFFRYNPHTCGIIRTNLLETRI